MTARTPQDRERRLHLADATLGILPELQPDYDAVAELLHEAGECARCKAHAARRTAIALVPGNSGPGWTVYGCIDCAKLMASFSTASDWLREQVARLEAAGL